MPHGVISQGRGGLYTVIEDETGFSYILRAKKIFRRIGIQPTVGDYITFTPGNQSDEHGWIEEIDRRTNFLTRPPVANISLIMILAAPVPEPDWLLIDKLLIQAQKQGIKSMIVVTKCDLDAGSLFKNTQENYSKARCSIERIAKNNREDLSALKNKLHNEHACLAGQSGVGKSTLLNALLDLDEQTGALSMHIQRGKNTTRHTQLFRNKDICLFDTPGFTLLEEENNEDPVNLQMWYPEFQPYLDKCRFQPCYHDKEPDCAIKSHVGTDIPYGRYHRYIDLLHHDREQWKSRFQ